MTSSTHRLLYTMIDAEVRKLQTKIYSLRHELSALEQQELIHKGIQQELKQGICQSCGGQQYVRVQYAQDDIKAEKCDTCNGTGLI